MKTVIDCQEQLQKLHDEATALVDQAKAEERDFTAAESARFDKIRAESEILKAREKQLAWAEQEGDRLNTSTRLTGLQPTGPAFSDPTTGGPGMIEASYDRNGSAFFSLTNKQRLVDIPRERGTPSAGELSFGKTVCAWLTGDWSRAREEKKFLAALSTDSNQAGGILIPIELSKSIIDIARNATRVIQAGAQTVLMGSDHLVMPRLKTDPTPAFVGENVEITSQDVTFDSVNLVARKMAILMTMSRELVEDSVSLPAFLEQVMGKAMALEFDRVALLGDGGSGEPVGLLNADSVTSTGIGGAIAWSDVHDAVIRCRADNYEPTAIIASPTIQGDLDVLQSGDGSTSAALWQGPPPSITEIPRYSTSNCPDANFFIGDFKMLALGIRSGPMIEVSTEAGDAFKKHQLLLKITQRFDVSVMDPKAFEVATGITT
jgi:HK97 family phage major capsid protein